MSGTCAEFDRWLDDDRPATGEASARAHAARCARCASRLAAQAEIDRLLASPPLAAAGAGFADRVMHRIAGAAEPAAERGLPWWLRLAAEPALTLAIALAVATAGTRGWIWAGSLAIARGADQLWQRAGTLAVTSATRTGGASLGALWRSQPWVAGDALAVTGALLALAPALLVGSWTLFRWLERSLGAPRLRRAGH